MYQFAIACCPACEADGEHKIVTFTDGAKDAIAECSDCGEEFNVDAEQVEER